MAKCEGDVVKDPDPVHSLGKIMNLENFISNRALRPEVNVGILSGTRADVVELNFQELSFWKLPVWTWRHLRRTWK